MLKNSSNGWMRMSYLVLIPMLAVLVYSCNLSNNKKIKAPADATEAAVAPESFAFDAVEQKPMFNGGDANEFAKWVYSQLEYPEAAKEAGEEGRVLLQFTVNADGSMSDATVLRSASPELDAEALRVVNSCTQKWTPGMQDGKAVPVSFSIPIVFKLN